MSGPIPSNPPSFPKKASAKHAQKLKKEGRLKNIPVKQRESREGREMTSLFESRLSRTYGTATPQNPPPAQGGNDINNNIITTLSNKNNTKSSRNSKYSQKTNNPTANKTNGVAFKGALNSAQKANSTAPTQKPDKNQISPARCAFYRNPNEKYAKPIPWEELLSYREKEIAGEGAIYLPNPKTGELPCSNRGRENLQKKGIDPDKIFIQVPENATEEMKEFIKAVKDFKVVVNNHAFNRLFDRYLKTTEAAKTELENIKKKVEEVRDELFKEEPIQVQEKDKKPIEENEVSDEKKTFTFVGLFKNKLNKARRSQEKAFEEKTYIKLIKLLRFIETELRKEEEGEWDISQEAIALEKGELERKEVERLCEEIISFLEKVVREDPCKILSIVLVSKIECVAFLAGLPNIGFMAEGAENGQRKVITKLTRKDMESLLGIDEKTNLFALELLVEKPPRVEKLEVADKQSNQIAVTEDDKNVSDTKTAGIAAFRASLYPFSLKNIPIKVTKNDDESLNSVEGKGKASEGKDTPKDQSSELPTNQSDKNKSHSSSRKQEVNDSALNVKRPYRQDDKPHAAEKKPVSKKNRKGKGKNPPDIAS